MLEKLKVTPLQSVTAELEPRAVTGKMLLHRKQQMRLRGRWREKERRYNKCDVASGTDAQWRHADCIQTMLQQHCSIEAHKVSNQSHQGSATPLRLIAFINVLLQSGGSESCRVLVTCSDPHCPENRRKISRTKLLLLRQIHSTTDQTNRRVESEATAGRRRQMSGISDVHLHGGCTHEWLYDD